MIKKLQKKRQSLVEAIGQHGSAMIDLLARNEAPAEAVLDTLSKFTDSVKSVIDFDSKINIVLLGRKFDSDARQDTFICPYCNTGWLLIELAVDRAGNRMCPQCGHTI